MTKTLRTYLWTLTTIACAIGGALAMGMANAAVDQAAMREARAQFDRDRAFCRSPENTQNVRDCLKEAAAAYDEAQWKARGRAESPRALQQPRAQALSSGLGPGADISGSGTGSDTGAGATTGSGTEAAADRAGRADRK